MNKFSYNSRELSLMENSCIPSAVYQFIDGRVVTIALTKGFLDLFDFQDKNFAYALMDNDMYRDCHPDDVVVLENAAINFATKNTPYNVIYRSKIKGEYRIIHAIGEHVYKDDVKLAIIWYIDEGKYEKEVSQIQNVLGTAYSNLLNTNDEENLNRFDFLTGMPTISNFFYLVETHYFKETLNQGKTPVMLFFDLNGMKYFNAKYGFSEGDNLIRAFAHLLSQTFSNECCCRVGMDRFCVFTNDENLEDRLWSLFAECENINNGRTLPVRCGIYSREIEDCGASYACDRAKMACDANKNSYLSHFTYFDKEMLALAEKREYIINNIDNAIKEGWIKVYYQPIIRSTNDKVCDEEALSRWIDPVKGFMNPAEFISILEDTNLIYKLDLYVVEQVLKKMKDQKDKGLFVVPISINLSRSDFETCDIVSEIQTRVKESGISPEKITIEITESIIGKDYDYMKSQILRFQSLGFKVWMDDFGSGYSSIEVLHDIQFDLIKFDMKFMRQFYENDKTKILLSGLMKTVTSLGIDTICEGVETEHQVEFLKEIGCTKLQGFFYCQPIPVEKIFERYEKGIQIGFENPDESDYFTSLGKINLYDISVITNSDSESYDNYFNTLPMSILEVDEKQLRIVRGNKSYKEFLRKYFGTIQQANSVDFASSLEKHGDKFIKTLDRCKKTNNPIIIDEKLSDGATIHVYIRRIAINTITNVTAFITVILGIND